jgi:hypothetical protein
MRRTALWIVVSALTLTALGACDDSERTLALFKDRQGEWKRELARLRRNNAEIATRMNRNALPAGSGGGAAAAEQLRGTTAGLEQGLADLEIEAAVSARRVQVALERGGDPATRTLEDESARMRDHLVAARERLDRTRRELTDMERSQQPKGAEE